MFDYAATQAETLSQSQRKAMDTIVTLINRHAETYGVEPYRVAVETVTEGSGCPKAISVFVQCDDGSNIHTYAFLVGQRGGIDLKVAPRFMRQFAGRKVFGVNVKDSSKA